MRVVVDTNIVFSTLLNPQSPIAHVLLSHQEKITFFAPRFLQKEILKYAHKIIQYSKLSEKELDIIQESVFYSIKLISEDLIDPESWKKAFELTKNIDEDDTPFVALSIDLNARLWTGDKKLRIGLEKDHPELVISFEKLQEMMKL